MILPFPRPLLLGHRGSPFQAPENSLLSFALALEAGADGVELDVQRSADGVPVVIHDPTLERSGHGEGPVAARTWEELSRLRGAGGEPIPSLRQVAEWASSSDAWLNVEIKAERVEAATLEALRDGGVLDRCFLSSFHAPVMERLAEMAPGALRFLLSEVWDPGVLRAARRAAVAGVCLRDDAATPAALEDLRRERLAAVIWTVDDTARIQALFETGAAAVITNRPSPPGPLSQVWERG